MKQTNTTKADALRTARLDQHNGGTYLGATNALTAVVTTDDAEPCAYGYRGSSMKPVFRYRFLSVEKRDQYAADWLQSENRAIAEHAKRISERRAPHSLAVGDVLYSSWGYDQTNVAFYEVVSVRGAVVDLFKLKQNRTEMSVGMQGTCTPRKSDYSGELIKGKRPTGHNTVKIDSCEQASRWDGRPVSWSSYA